MICSLVALNDVSVVKPIETIRDVLKADTFYKTMIKYSFLLIALFFAACSSKEKYQVPEEFQHLKNLSVYSADTKPPKTISFTKEAIYGNSKEVLIGVMGDVTVDRLGRIFIADVQKQIVHVFESGGEFIDQLGREGRGPSEFGSIKSLQIRKDNLYAFDFSQNRVNIFSLDTLRSGNTTVLARNRRDYQNLKGAFPSIDELYVRDNDTYIAKFISGSSRGYQQWQNVEVKGLLYLLNANGMITSELFEYTSETRTVLEVLIYPIEDFFGETLIAVLSDNRIYLAEPDHFLIKVYSPEGIYQSAFYHPLDKIPLTEESAVKAEVSNMFVKDMNSMDLPENWPVLTDMKIDNQNRLWIATTVEDMKVYEWWVLEETGELITKFEWPRDQPIQEIKNGYLYSKKTDEETDTEFVAKYRIELTER
ncbi:MAG TPA: 6-bladed beta-propeller [Gracilimonas sp.]|uniref:6-bladed beta-propeller n=1 Tax=Gracilimonas sp. TaxID=1974203 RepID=UPI002D95D86C|nr:6-bladed beta-propeller [Gracilimonas sp.]